MATWCAGRAGSIDGSGLSNGSRHGGNASCAPTRAGSLTGSGRPDSSGSDDKSRVTGDCHARFCGSPGARFPRATRLKKAREARQAQTPPDAPLTESERMELIRLRGESRDKDATIAELRMQVEFAKKVATWFAKEKQ